MTRPQPAHGSAADRDERDQLATDLLTQLLKAISGAEALLRGSLAEGRADRFSDVDLPWEVPDADFQRAVADLPHTLARVRDVASLRFDPDFQRSAKRRLVFVRFAGVPLFWRVDLDIFARSVGREPGWGRDNSAARGTDWSVAESALANAVAAITAHMRGDDAAAAALLDRAEQRVGLAVANADTRRRILRLVDAITEMNATTAAVAVDIRCLVAEALREPNAIIAGDAS
jgi:hypothetical protein